MFTLKQKQKVQQVHIKVDHTKSPGLISFIESIGTSSVLQSYI